MHNVVRGEKDGDVPGAAGTMDVDGRKEEKLLPKRVSKNDWRERNLRRKTVVNRRQRGYILLGTRRRREEHKRLNNKNK